MKSRPCGWVFRVSRASRAVRERRLPCLCGLACPSYERRLAVFLQGLSRRSAGHLARFLPCAPVVHCARSRHQDSLSEQQFVRPSVLARRVFRALRSAVVQNPAELGNCAQLHPARPHWAMLCAAVQWRTFKCHVAVLLLRIMEDRDGGWAVAAVRAPVRASRAAF